MITARDVDAVLRDVPFRPFKIHLTNGIVHEIRHPEMAMVTSRNVIVGLPRADSQTIMRKYHLVSILHIVQIDAVSEGRDQPPATSDVPANAA